VINLEKVQNLFKVQRTACLLLIIPEFTPYVKKENLPSVLSRCLTVNLEKVLNLFKV
jgi:hypothetical protein